MVKIPVDNRPKLWAQLEKKIQSNAKYKDKFFILAGKWKRFIRYENGYKIFSVDAEWIRKNLCIYFGHGGHGSVHEFIPLNEIWIASHHYNKGEDSLFNCHCKTRKKGQKVSKKYFNSTVIHEITECKKMEKGKSYWESHQIALKKEKQAGLLINPFYDR